MSSSVGASTRRRHRIGYAMLTKKANTIFKDSLINLASDRGIDLVPIALDKPLIEQPAGPFHAIIHKLYSQEWRQQLHEFSNKNPGVTIIDPLDNIYKLHNRTTMLEVVTHLPLSPQNRPESIGIPKQVLVESSSSVVDDLKFPVIAKPAAADGSDGCHKMFLVFNKDGLSELEPTTPFVLQEFVNHGGVVFKVYVAGDHVRCVKRKSLADISQDKLSETSHNLLPFSQVSNVTAQSYSVDDNLAKLIEQAEMPRPGFVTQMGQALRKALKLNLFNFDLIRDSNDVNRYLVIDINYFPGYGKIPSYETMLTDFFVDIVQSNQIV